MLLLLVTLWKWYQTVSTNQRFPFCSLNSKFLMLFLQLNTPVELPQIPTCLHCLFKHSPIDEYLNYSNFVIVINNFAVNSYASINHSAKR
jgi:hypothetical protein